MFCRPHAAIVPRWMPHILPLPREREIADIYSARCNDGGRACTYHAEPLGLTRITVIFLVPLRSMYASACIFMLDYYSLMSLAFLGRDWDGNCKYDYVAIRGSWLSIYELHCRNLKL